MEQQRSMGSVTKFGFWTDSLVGDNCKILQFVKGQL